MRRLGTVTRTAQGLAIVRCDEGDEAPDLGTVAVDESLSDVGRVAEGYRADLLVLDDDPNEDVTAWRDAAAVYRDGERVA